MLHPPCLLLRWLRVFGSSRLGHCTGRHRSCLMSLANQLSVLNPVITFPNGRLTVVQGPHSRHGCALYISGELQAPVDGDLAQVVGALLDRGERVIVLDLTQTARIDAAGVGELVRAHNMAIAANSALRVEHPPTRVRYILDRVGLLDILCRG